MVTNDPKKHNGYELSFDLVHRIENSNWISRLLWIGPDLSGLKKCAANFFKHAKAAAFQLSAAADRL
jgi:hypothetical protein